MIILVAARLVGALAQKVGQPRVVGEILAGVLLGPSLLGPEIFQWDNPWGFLDCKDALALSPQDDRASITTCFFPPQSRPVIGIIGQLALVFFMFLVGLELDFDLLKGKLRGIATLALGVVVVPVVFGLGVGELLYDEKFVANFGGDAAPSKLAFSLFIGAMLAVTAFPVMARILQEKGLTQSLMGAIGVAAAAVVTVLMFLVTAAADGVKSDDSTSDHVLRFVYVAVYIGVLFAVVRPLLKPLGRIYEEKGLTPEIFAIIIILLFASAYVADRLQVNVIVGAFLLGAILPAPRKLLFRDLSGRLAEITAIVLLPIFLAFSGLNTDFTVLRAEHIAGIGLFLIAGVVGKWGAGAVAARLGGLSWPEGNVLGILMNCRGLLVLVVALIALNGGVITPAMQVGGVLMALITTAMTGPLFDRFAGSVGAPKGGPEEPPRFVTEHRLPDYFGGASAAEPGPQAEPPPAPA
ncbi:MAG: cation:proton antiporter [Dehalococcoidia bacterium]